VKVLSYCFAAPFLIEAMTMSQAQRQAQPRATQQRGKAYTCPKCGALLATAKLNEDGIVDGIWIHVDGEESWEEFKATFQIGCWRLNCRYGEIDIRPSVTHHTKA